MEKIKAYIINLESSVDRRDYMENVMAAFDCFDTEFIKAVDGRLMTDDEVSAAFDQKTAIKHYGRELRRGEIGCTLSHKKCAKKLLESELPFALFLEDDLVWQTDAFVQVLPAISGVLNTDKPIILLLSGDYWYTRKHGLSGDYQVADVHDAVCTQSYFINRSAAKLLLEIGNWHVADDWRAIRKFGVNIKGLFPHVADQNRSDLETVIAPVYGGIKRATMSLPCVVDSYLKSITNKMLVKMGKFEAKDFVWKK